MKNTSSYLIIGLFAMMVLSCKSGGGESSGNTDQPETASVKDVSELSIMDLFALVYPDSIGTAVEWHGEAMPNALVDSLEISQGEACGDQGCGKQLLMINKTARAIGVMTKADFSIRGRQAYLAREYVVEAGQTIRIGCSHLCYNGESFAFDRTIVGSWYMDE